MWVRARDNFTLILRLLVVELLTNSGGDAIVYLPWVVNRMVRAASPPAGAGLILSRLAVQRPGFRTARTDSRTAPGCGWDFMVA